MHIIDKILSSSFFENQPPVLVDIGASGEINAKWKAIAPYAVCIAFDADDREFNVTETTAAGYKKLITVNRIVTAATTQTADFYLTASPFCSSLLPPLIDKLSPWIFQSLFTVEKKIQLPAVTVANALQQANIKYVDWFKTDTQGTDLRLFLSTPEAIRQNILAAEFEPGIIDAYEGEDKLYSILQILPQQGFWLSSMEVKGTQRLHASYANKLGKFAASRSIRRSPCWSELTYLRNTFTTNQRNLLLLFVFALLERQYGFALELVDFATQQYQDTIFAEAKKAVLKKIQTEKLKLPLVMVKKQFNKLFATINA
ncbi:MAG TPA: hypothetical protein VK645_18155 [Chitinophagaceae bacterium]|nr:hypothetical protein [Chitinophagaceae bacterium]